MTEPAVLIIDDEEGIRESLSGIFEDEGYAVFTASSGEEALKMLRDQSPDLIMLDVWLPGIDGVQTLKEIRNMKPDLPVIMISGHGNIELAVKATKTGAYDFLEKPLSLERVILAAKRALERRNLEMENKALKRDLTREWRLIGDSGKMKQLREQIEMAAKSNSRVLILGESGSGKELVAHILHQNSHRTEKPFIEMNCAAIPQELIESELFGHEKGSFTGAFERKKGKFELADEGTLFLDEVGDMSLKTQAKVLRSLDEQRFEPVGASESIQVDVRVVASTNKNLEEEIERGNFREDLFYRLNVIPFHVPPLRERIEDVRLLAAYFLNEFTTAYGRKPKELTAEALRALEEYPWPGNVRELRNLMERIVIMNPQVRIDARHIPLDRARRAVFDRPMDRFGSLQEVREAAERDYILKKLEEAKGNVTRTAELLGLERSHLYRKMKALGIAPKE
jgi:two-component system nitrogen regulation response regulator NtrX